MSERDNRIAYGRATIKRDGHAVCACGQLFLEPDQYADHVAGCKHSQREVAARGKWEQD